VTVRTVYAALGSETGIIEALLAEMEGDAQAPVWRERTAAADEPAAKLRAFAGWTTLPTTRQGFDCLLAPMETKDNLCPGRDRRHDACGDSVRSPAGQEAGDHHDCFDRHLVGQSNIHVGAPPRAVVSSSTYDTVSRTPAWRGSPRMCPARRSSSGQCRVFEDRRGGGIRTRRTSCSSWHGWLHARQR